jgi:hypothetical protein
MLTLMSDMRKAGSQIVLATHSPILAALRGARILELGEHGVTPVAYGTPTPSAPGAPSSTHPTPTCTIYRLSRIMVRHHLRESGVCVTRS